MTMTERSTTHGLKMYQLCWLNIDKVLVHIGYQSTPISNFYLTSTNQYILETKIMDKTGIG